MPARQSTLQTQLFPDPEQARKLLATFWLPYKRGQAYLRLKKSAGAAAECRKILDHRGYAPLSPLYPLAQLGLARATQS